MQHFMVSIEKTACGHSQGNTFGGLYVNDPVGCKRAFVPRYAAFARKCRIIKFYNQGVHAATIICAMIGTVTSSNKWVRLGILQQYVLSGDGCFPSVCFV